MPGKSVNNRNLTPKQKKILDFITFYHKEKGFAPSLEEIGKHFKLKAVSTVHQHVKALRNKGYLKKEDNQPRGIAPLEKGKDVVEIPLLGFIAAGEPIEPIEDPEPIKVPLDMVKKPGQYYALKVKGDSMIEDGILDSDTVVIKHQLTAESGDTVVAVTEKGATLKILKKRNGKMFLEPRNKKLKKICPKELEIRGKFMGLVRMRRKYNERNR